MWWVSWWKQTSPKSSNRVSTFPTITFNFSFTKFSEDSNTSTVQEFITEIWSQEICWWTRIAIWKFATLVWRELILNNYKPSRLRWQITLQPGGTVHQKWYFPGKSTLLRSMFGRWDAFSLNCSSVSHSYQLVLRKSSWTWSRSSSETQVRRWFQELKTKRTKNSCFLFQNEKGRTSISYSRKLTHKQWTFWRKC